MRVHNELAFLLIRLSWLHTCLILSPFSRCLIEYGPLEMSLRMIHEHLGIDTLDFLIGNRLNLLQPEKTLTKVHSDSRTVVQRSSYDNMHIAVSDRSVRDLLCDSQVGFKGSEHLQLEEGEGATHYDCDTGNGRLYPGQREVQRHMADDHQHHNDDHDQRDPLRVSPWPQSSLQLAHPVLQFCPSLRTPEQPCHGLFSGPALAGLPWPLQRPARHDGLRGQQVTEGQPSRTAREAWTPDHCPWASRDSGIDSTSPTCRPSTSSNLVPVFPFSPAAARCWPGRGRSRSGSPARPVPCRRRVGEGGQRRPRQKQTPAG